MLIIAGSETLTINLSSVHPWKSKRVVRAQVRWSMLTDAFTQTHTRISSPHYIPSHVSHVKLGLDSLLSWRVDI